MTKCVLPWTSVRLYPYHFFNCCMAEYESYTFPDIFFSDPEHYKYNLDLIWNSPSFQLSRLMMIVGGPDKACRSIKRADFCPFRCFNIATKVEDAALTLTDITEEQKDNFFALREEIKAEEIVLKSYPVDIELFIDYNCNLSCPMCCILPQKRDPKYKDRFLDILANREIFEKFIRKAIRLSITGGEPIVSSRFWDLLDIVERTKGAKVFLLTNGLLLDRVLPYSHLLFYLRVSVDSFSKDTYRIVRGGDVEELKRQIVNFVHDSRTSHIKKILSFVVSGYNYNELPDFVRNTYNIGGIDHIDICEVHTIETWMQDRELYEWMKFKFDPLCKQEYLYRFQEMLDLAKKLKVKVYYSLASIDKFGCSEENYV